MTAELDVTLAQMQFFTGGDLDLFLNNVNAGNHFRDGMFDLDASIHFNEIKLSVFIQEFNSTGTAVADFFARRCAAFADLVAQTRVQMRCGRFFNHFLMTPLHGTVALTQINYIPMLVSQNLYLYMAWILKEFFHIDRRVIESGTGLGTRHGDGV